MYYPLARYLKVSSVVVGRSLKGNKSKKQETAVSGVEEQLKIRNCSRRDKG